MNKLTPYLLISAHTVNKCSFHGLFSATFLTFVGFYMEVFFFLFKMVPNGGPEVLCSVYKRRKAAEGLMEKICVCSISSFRHGLYAVGQHTELSVYESATYSKYVPLNRKHRRPGLYCSGGENAVTRGPQGLHSPSVSAGAQHPLLQCLQRLQNKSTVTDENPL